MRETGAHAVPAEVTAVANVIDLATGPGTKALSTAWIPPAAELF
jgi:hypothetical protein